MSLAAPKLVQGWIWLGALAAVLGGLLGPKIDSILSLNEELIEKSELITHYESRLREPLSADQSLPYRSYVLTSVAEGEALNDIQTSLLDLIRQSQARLIDLREVPTSNRLGSLSALMYKVEIEGDLQAVLEAIEALGASEYPVLIDRLELRPMERSDRPDRLVRLSANLTIWNGDM